MWTHEYDESVATITTTHVIITPPPKHAEWSFLYTSYTYMFVRVLICWRNFSQTFNIYEVIFHNSYMSIRIGAFWCNDIPHWVWNKMATISTTFSKTQFLEWRLFWFSKIHWHFFPRGKCSISQQWTGLVPYGRQDISWSNNDQVLRRLCVTWSPGFGSKMDYHDYPINKVLRL